MLAGWRAKEERNTMFDNGSPEAKCAVSIKLHHSDAGAMCCSVRSPAEQIVSSSAARMAPNVVISN